MNLERYIRQTSLAETGREKQIKLRQSHALLVGIGGIGGTAALYLTAGGIGKITIVDNDTVALHNLQRQILYRTSQTGQSKIDCARELLEQLNPDVEFNFINTRFTPENALSIIQGCDIIVDGSDNPALRYLLNDLSVGLDIPYVFGSIYHFYGQVSVFNSKPDSATYRCLYPQEEDALEHFKTFRPGEFGCLPGIIATLEVNETVKTLCGFGENLQNRLLTVDLLAPSFKTYSIIPSAQERCRALENYNRLKTQV
ncbi:MAG: HesA/MoeB/ThiF family protein [Bacteroidales bacterium]|jgi:adenylyltransferase/sulfurtransferase|nr:HesA/MoeB/ThiF family protein [Bacteroidales bacterium]